MKLLLGVVLFVNGPIVFAASKTNQPAVDMSHCTAFMQNERNNAAIQFRTDGSLNDRELVGSGEFPHYTDKIEGKNETITLEKSESTPANPYSKGGTNTLRIIVDRVAGQVQKITVTRSSFINPTIPNPNWPALPGSDTTTEYNFRYANNVCTPQSEVLSRQNYPPSPYTTVNASKVFDIDGCHQLSQYFSDHTLQEADSDLHVLKGIVARTSSVSSPYPPLLNPYAFGQGGPLGVGLAFGMDSLPRPYPDATPSEATVVTMAKSGLSACNGIPSIHDALADNRLWTVVPPGTSAPPALGQAPPALGTDQAPAAAPER